eukprot:403344069
MTEHFKAAPTKAIFDEFVAQAGDRPVFVDFYATWCGKCELLKPDLEAIADAHLEQAIYIKVDVEENEEIAEEFQVESLPTVIVLRGREKKGEMKGSKPENFKKFMEEALA